MNGTIWLAPSPTYTVQRVKLAHARLNRNDEHFACGTRIGFTGYGFLDEVAAPEANKHPRKWYCKRCLAKTNTTA